MENIESEINSNILKVIIAYHEILAEEIQRRSRDQMFCVTASMGIIGTSIPITLQFPMYYFIIAGVPWILAAFGVIWFEHHHAIAVIGKYKREVEEKYNKKIYEADPDRCCNLLKVDPAREAVKDLDAWICGLRNTEGRTRKDYQEIESRGLVKINHILNWTEEEVWKYLEDHKIELHPWYSKVFPDGRRIRSLGCEPCTIPVYDYQEERDGRWQGTSKCGGECGIHTKTLK